MRVIVEVIPGNPYRVWQEGGMGGRRQQEIAATQCGSKEEALKAASSLLPDYRVIQEIGDERR